MKNLVSGIVLCILTLGLNPVNAAIEDPLKVGVLLPLTGKLAKYGNIEQKSFIMAAEEINAALDFNDRKIELIFKDTQGNSDVGRAAIEKLIHEHGVVAIGGGYSSSVTWETSKIAQQNKIAFLMNTAAADKITEQGWEYIFRLNPPVSEYPRTLNTFVKEVAADVKAVAILHEDSLLGVSQARKFTKQAQNLGLQVSITQAFTTNAKDFKPLLKQVKAKKPDLVYMVARSKDAALLMRQAREINLNPKLFLGHAVGFTRQEFQSEAGDAAEYAWSASRWAPSAPYPDAREYFDKFAKRYGIYPDYHGAQAYSAMYVIADALRRADALTPEGVRNALAKTDMMTVFGPVKFVSYEKKVQQNQLPTLLVQWINGKLEVVWPQNNATQKYVFPTPKWGDR